MKNILREYRIIEAILNYFKNNEDRDEKEIIKYVRENVDKKLLPEGDRIITRLFIDFSEIYDSLSEEPTAVETVERKKIIDIITRCRVEENLDENETLSEVFLKMEWSKDIKNQLKEIYNIYLSIQEFNKVISNIDTDKLFNDMSHEELEYEYNKKIEGRVFEENKDEIIDNNGEILNDGTSLDNNEESLFDSLNQMANGGEDKSKETPKLSLGEFLRNICYVLSAIALLVVIFGKKKR